MFLHFSFHEHRREVSCKGMLYRCLGSDSGQVKYLT